jgi:hypothetical protein
MTKSFILIFFARILSFPNLLQEALFINGWPLFYWSRLPHPNNANLAEVNFFSVTLLNWEPKKRKGTANRCPNNQIIKSYFKSPRARALPRYATNRVVVVVVVVVAAAADAIEQPREVRVLTVHRRRPEIVVHIRQYLSDSVFLGFLIFFN